MSMLVTTGLRPCGALRGAWAWRVRGVQGRTRRWPPLGEGHRGLTLVGYPPPPPPVAVPPLSVDNSSVQYTLAAALANLAALVMVNPGLRSRISLMMSS